MMRAPAYKHSMPITGTATIPFKTAAKTSALTGFSEETLPIAPSRVATVMAVEGVRLHMPKREFCRPLPRFAHRVHSRPERTVRADCTHSREALTVIAPRALAMTLIFLGLSSWRGGAPRSLPRIFDAEQTNQFAGGLTCD
jgi:hypothetical protein